MTQTKMNTQTRGNNLTLRVNDFDLSYDDIGEGKVPIIFLHGFPFDKSMWKSQLDALKASNRVIACDIRGFGQSVDEDTMLSIDLFAEDLIDFMNELRIEKAIICGLSMGGYITLNAARRFPDRFEALILCDTQCNADNDDVKAKRQSAIEGIEANGPAEFNEKFLLSVFHKDSIAKKESLVKDLRKVVNANSPNIIINGLNAISQRSETCSVLDKIEVPTLIICGRDDQVTPLTQSEAMHSQIEDSVLRIIENAGHVSNLEQTEDFNTQVIDFLAMLSDSKFEKINGKRRMA